MAKSLLKWASRTFFSIIQICDLLYLQKLTFFKYFQIIINASIIDFAYFSHNFITLINVNF